LSFKNQTIVITGAAGNLGSAVAKTFYEANARVVLVDAKGELLDRRFPDSDNRYVKVPVNLLQREMVLSAFEKIQDEHDGIDALCAIAGGFYMGEAVHDTATDIWELMNDLNVQTLLNSTAAVVPHMIERGGGKIVTIGANAALRGIPGMGSYCAAKSTVMRLTESMAGELRTKSINVNCVMPSIIDTPVNRADMPDANPAHWVTTSDLASVIMFLCSEEANAIHGALIPVVGLS